MTSRTKLCLSAAIILGALFTLGVITANADTPNLINYQGVLKSGGTPVTTPVSVVFNLWNDFSGGALRWSETQTVAPDADGRFNVTLGSVASISDSIFWGTNVYLGVKVGADPEMTPRQRLVATGYAFSDAWGTNNTARGADATVGGGLSNTASGEDATVGGGLSNTASGNYSTVGGGGINSASGDVSTVGGGAFNRARNEFTVVAGGGGPFVFDSNSALGYASAILGGMGNIATGDSSCIGGGTRNTATGSSSTVPGGYRNTASGAYSFAAGRRAKATNAGAFVWADQTDADFTSTASNQFLIRAGGGVGIGMTSPDAQLNVETGAKRAAEFLNNYSSVGIGADAAAVRIENLNAVGVGSYTVCNTIDAAVVITNTSTGITLKCLGTGFTDDFVVRADGKVGVGRNPTTNPFEVEGNASKTTAGSWLANSDARIKTDVQSIDNALEVISRLRPVEFRYTEAYRAAHPSVGDRTYVNYIAQEFQRVFPDDVKSGGEDGILQIDTHPAFIYAVAAIQELHKKTQKIEELEEQLAQMKKILDKLVAEKL